MTGLERFVKAKQAEVGALERLAGQSGAFDEGGPLCPWKGERPAFRAALEQGGGRRGLPLAVIAEFKKASPSRGVICEGLSVEEAAHQYADSGANALSILTEKQYFHGDMDYLRRATSEVPAMPLLRKDFLFHPLQVAATLASPASALLLIVRLTPDAALLRALREQAESAGVEAVVEVFDEADLRLARESGARIIQVNARDLVTLKVDRTACLRLARISPPRDGELWTAASGISCRNDLEAAAEAGFHAALVGSALMEGGAPGKALRRLLNGGEPC
ncbi:indole-3-glycerol-phosphate synthase [Mailhella sp.]|uniref:indole-3-glycerol-phosphate synthase n=1 Tax=Mailhella sp. TaxID=1981029 RepID=UPI00406382DA